VPVPALTTMPRKLSPPTTSAAAIMKMIQVAVNGQWNSACVTDDTRQPNSTIVVGPMSISIGEYPQPTRNPIDGWMPAAG
jgi:hypothetical protein